MKSTPWWKEAVIYQIYPRSFYDSNGDGEGVESANEEGAAMTNTKTLRASPAIRPNFMAT